MRLFLKLILRPLGVEISLALKNEVKEESFGHYLHIWNAFRSRIKWVPGAFFKRWKKILLCALNSLLSLKIGFLFFTDYLLSNNHVNSIIVHKFDFSDEEVMAYYISFLKTLSFRLNKHTIHFFYNEVSISLAGRPLKLS